MGSKMTVGKKLSLICAALVMLTVILGTVSIVNINRMNTSVSSITQDSLPGLSNLAIMVETAYKSTYFAMLSIGSDNLQNKIQDEAIVTSELNRFDVAAKAYQSIDKSPRAQEIMAKILTAHAQMYSGWLKVMPLSRSLKNNEAYAMWVSQLATHVEERAAGIEELIAYSSSNASGLGKSAIDTGSNARLWTLLILLFSILSGGMLAYFLVRSINKVLSQAVSELSEGAGQIASAASQVSASSQSLAQGSSEQAASLEETSSSSEEINSMARKNTDNSMTMATLVGQSQDAFIKTNQQLKEMVVSMDEINQSSGKISKIIKVIDEIAFQTNILALNAAVEAARAGEAGMGFAVVADEVRNLAQRSAQAAKDTAILIEESISKSNSGQAKVDQVAAAIRAITEDSGKIKILVDEVTLGSGEQSRGLEQIARAISQMEQVTQTTAANAEQSAAAAEELTAQSEAMKDVVAQLNAMVGGGSNVGSRVASRREFSHSATSLQQR